VRCARRGFDRFGFAIDLSALCAFAVTSVCSVYSVG
jgi:hypothetical protein